MQLHHIIWTVLIILVLIFVWRKWQSREQGTNPTMQ